MPICYSYVRVSDEKQAASKGGTGISEDEQRITNREFYERVLKPQGIVWSNTPFEDAAVSASKREFARRPAGRALLRVMRPGDHLVVARSSRAFRDMRDCLNTEEMLRSYGVILHCLDLPFDTSSSASARLSRNMLAAIDQWYSDQLSERMFAVSRFLKSKGRVAGGSPHLKPYGYIRLPDKMLGPDLPERQIVEFLMHETHFGVCRDDLIFARLEKMFAMGALKNGERAWTEKHVRYAREGFWRIVEREGVDWILGEQLREWARGQIDGRRKRIRATVLR